MKINIEKQLCDRCHKKTITEQNAIFVTFRGVEIAFCNECAIEFGHLLIDSAKLNQEHNVS